MCVLNFDSNSAAPVRRLQLHAFELAGPVVKKWLISFFSGVYWRCEVLHAGTARCREQINRSLGRGEDCQILGSVGALLRSCTFDRHFTRPLIERTGYAYDALHPPRWIYGEGVPYALTQLLELLAAAEAAPLGLNTPTWITEDGTPNLI